MVINGKETGKVICGIKEYSCEGVRFLFKPGKKKIVVSFSAFGPRGSEQKYNYLKDFINTDLSILSFLDEDEPRSDPRGTYYLGKDCSGSYLRKIDRIVNKIAGLQEVSIDDIWLVGSSKGGTAALLMGFRYGYKNIFVNAPQYKIATYIKRRSEEIYQFLTDGSLDKQKYVDEIIAKSICGVKDINISITCGMDDHYHNRELFFYEERFIKLNIPYKKIIIPGGHDSKSIVHYRRLLQDEMKLI